uniref:Uncharacterized protein n=1 Tax=Triticum urartu TaxID=4572 RepID=A0A8R7Q2N2_TRIUA
MGEELAPHLTHPPACPRHQLSCRWQRLRRTEVASSIPAARPRRERPSGEPPGRGLEQRRGPSLCGASRPASGTPVARPTAGRRAARGGGEQPAIREGGGGGEWVHPS